MIRTQCSLLVILLLLLFTFLATGSAQGLQPIRQDASTPSPAVLATDPASRFVGDPLFAPTQMAVDSAGNIYVAGNMQKPIANGFQVLQGELYKVNPQFELMFSVPIGGSASTQITGMALDPAGNVYLVGNTSSTDLPTMNPIQPQMNGRGDVFLTKLDSDGNLLFSTYLGGSNPEVANALTVDAEGNAFIAGNTGSSDFPSTPGAYLAEFTSASSTSSGLSFVVKIATESSTLEYSTGFGGGVPGDIFAIVEVGGGDVFLLAYFNTTDFPVTDPSISDPSKWVLARLSADGSKLLYSRYASSLNGPLTGLILDRDGNPVMVGFTQAVTINPATNSELSNVHGSIAVGNIMFGGHIIMDADGNLLGVAQGGPNDVDLSLPYPSGKSYVVKSAPDGKMLFFTRVPISPISVATGPNRAVYLLGASGFVSRIYPDQTDPSKVLPRMLGIANAAGPNVSPRVAPGELMSLYGPSIGSEAETLTEIGSDGLVTTSLGGVEVRFNGTPGRMLYSGPLQINVAAPFVWGQGDSVLVEVFHSGDLWSSLMLNPTDAEPGVFPTPIPGWGAAAAYNQDQTFNTQDNPAAPGSIVTVFMSGAGDMMGASYQDGQVFDPSTSLADLPAPKLPVTITVRNGTADGPLEILYAGQTPSSLAGIIQINFKVPLQPPPSQNNLTPPEPFALTVGDSRPVTFQVWVAGADGQ